MDSHKLRPKILGNTGKFRGVEAVMAPTHPHLDGNRHANRFDRRRNQPGCQRYIAHERRSCIAVYNLADRAPHIDVDNRRAPILRKPGCLGHLFRLTPDELHRHRLFNGVPRRFLDGLAGFTDRSRAGDHLGHVQA